MSVCDFITELSRLRKSSRDSIDNIEEFDRFKKYMHVQRSVEIDLKSILKKVNENEGKTLILLCGSAGDGKSHLLSYLKNVDQEALLRDYNILNDGTESSAPSKTAIDTLNDLLDDFSDEKLSMPGKNIILAINLGVLSNFIESDYGQRFSMLRTYVNRSGILISTVSEQLYNPESYFQHISFADYHMYSLSESGVRSEYIDALLNKVVCKSEENYFYKLYLKMAEKCPLAQMCPVKHNFELLQEKKSRNFVADLLVKVIIQDKEILTTREILNFFYDILVHPDFDYVRLCDLQTNDLTYLKEYIKYLTPTLIYENNSSSLISKLKKYDPLLHRSEREDEIAISYYVSSDVTNEVKKSFAETAYENVINRPSVLNNLNEDQNLKVRIYSTITRIQAMQNKKEELIYTNYLHDLYYYNLGKVPKLRDLYNKVERAVLQWCGNDFEVYVRLEEQQNFILYETIELKESLERLPKKKENEELIRFIPVITVEFKDEKRNNIISLVIDYSLYELISKLERGYIQTIDDRNNFADFVRFTDKIIKTGDADKKIYAVANYGKKVEIEKSNFGYRFRVVK